MRFHDFNKFMQGYYDAAHYGLCRDQNPYKYGTKEHIDWNEGYFTWEQEEQEKDMHIANMGGEPS